MSNKTVRLNEKTKVCVFMNEVKCETVGDSEAQGRTCVVNRWSHSSIPCVGEREESIAHTLLPIPTGVSLQRLGIPATPSPKERQLIVQLIRGSRLYAFSCLPLTLIMFSGCFTVKQTKGPVYPSSFSRRNNFYKPCKFYGVNR